ncbi:mitochondrial mRNA pseudouridine synthase Trub2-like [Gigantopelta aegis]|uniref:mitochondrial mRNA pseudouridine synthase Trub2-like n=1 Tax=Gigantopelta aegis TaxID=1735272 RepID=UPI001B88A891|nr:mitochondrial mRNA pseudouridine synthase Trub2-like [Gigantopelta aegis]XP_041370714.1 mitochondrial mRNA pseudouridine synthase Trub2-like [Gigantopelta aegis]
MKFDWAPAVYRNLNGILCVYKPSGLPVHKVTEIIQANIVRDLNALPCYKYERLVRNVNTDPVTAAATTSLSMPTVTTQPTVQDELSEHRLVLGPRYIPSDITMRHIHGLSRHTSGVLVYGVGRGCQYIEHIAQAKYLRVYHVKGRFGWATENFSPKGRIIERTSFRHITKPKLDKVCASAQAGHTKNMFEYAGVHPDSQAAYELAARGLVRPAHGQTPPMLYGVKCIDFNPPDFTLEIHAINEKCTYMGHLIHDIGLQLKSGAVCTHIRRLRYGHFLLDHALLRNDWTLENILLNMRLCRPLVSVDKLLSDINIKQLPSGADVRRISSGHDVADTEPRLSNTRTKNIVSLLDSKSEINDDSLIRGDNANDDSLKGGNDENDSLIRGDNANDDSLIRGDNANDDSLKGGDDENDSLIRGDDAEDISYKRNERMYPSR